MHIEFKDLSASFCWTNKPTIQMSLDFILHPTTNIHSCSIRTLVDVLAQILDSFQSSRDLNIEMTIKEKKLRTVRDHILIGESGPMSSTERRSSEWAGVEWNHSGVEGFDNKMENNLGLSSCAVPRSAVACVVAYFRRTELLSGVSERSGIDW